MSISSIGLKIFKINKLRKAFSCIDNIKVKIVFLLLLTYNLPNLKAQLTNLYTSTNEINGRTFIDVVVSNNVIYGLASHGGLSPSYGGCLFKINIDGSGFVKLKDFTNTSSGTTPKFLIIDGDYLYGVTGYGGQYDGGCIFKIKTDGSGFTRLIDFQRKNGNLAGCNDIIISNNTIFGMTHSLGLNGLGSVFKMNIDGTGYVDLYSFSGLDGSTPNGGLTIDNGILYGTTSIGGQYNNGCIFKINVNGTDYQKIFDFNGTNGSWPNEVTLKADFLYGTTGQSGSAGTIYKIKPDGTNYAKIHDFLGTNSIPSDGEQPWGRLLVWNNDLYGITYKGGNNNQGTLFKFDESGSGYTKLADFNESLPGAYPYSEPFIYNGAFYGSLSYGTWGYKWGSVYKYIPCLPDPPGTITGSPSVCQSQANVQYSVATIVNATSYIWEYNGSGVTITNETTNNITINFAPNATSGNLTVKGSSACGNGPVSANFPITVNTLPASGGSINGSSSVCPGQSGVSYMVPAIANATSYSWEYSGIGATINNGTSNNITINFAPNATSGNLTVKGVNSCGSGIASQNFPIQLNTGSGSNEWIRKNNLPSDIDFFSLGNLPLQTSCTNGVRGYNMLYSIFMEYDPATDSWNRKVDYPVGTSGGQSSFAIGDKVYVGLGHDVLQGNNFWVYDIPGNTWTSIASIPSTANAGNTISFGTGFSIGAKGYVCGSHRFNNELFSELWEYNVDLDTWTRKADLPISIQGASVFVINNKAYICGGVNGNLGYSSNELWVYDPQTDHWERKADFPGQSRYMHMAFSIGVKGYLGGGTPHSGSSNVKDIWEYNPNSNNWTKVTDFPGNGSIGLMAFSINGKAYVGGGQYKDFWEYSPGEQIDISGPSEVCPDQKGAVYSIPASGNFLSYSWQYSGTGAFINNSSTNEITIDFTNATSGNLILNGINSCGNQLLLDTYPISILSKPQPAGQITGSSSVFAGQSNVPFSVPEIIGATGYHWSVPSGATIISGDNTRVIRVNFSNNAQSGNVSVYGTNSCGAGIASANFPVSVNSDLTATLSGNRPDMCLGLNNFLYINCWGGTPPYSVTYSVNNGSSVVENTVAITSNEPYQLVINESGTYTLLSISDNNGANVAISNQSSVVAVYPLPEPAGYISGPSEVVPGQSFVYSVPVLANATGYEWSVPGGAQIVQGENTNRVTVYFSSSVDGYIEVRGTNDGGCSGNPGNLYVSSPNMDEIICSNKPGIIYISYSTPAPYTVTIETPNGNENVYVPYDGYAYNVLSGGTYTLADVYDSEGNQVGYINQSYTFTQLNTPDPASSISGPSTVYRGNPNEYYSVPEIAGATVYVWTLPYGATITSGDGTNSITVDFAEDAESGNISVYGANSCEQGGATDFWVNVMYIPGANIEGTATICEGQTTDLTVTCWDGVAPYSVEYTLDDGGNTETDIINVPDNNPYSFTVERGGTYTLNSITDNNGITTTINDKSVMVTMDPLPTLAESIEGPSEVIVGASDVVYSTPEISNATDYIWEYTGQGASINGNGNSVTISFASDATSGDLIVRGNNACGTGESISFPITVSAVPVQASLSGSTSICPGQSANLTITCTNGTAPYTVTYEFNDGTTTVSESVEIADNNPYILTVNQVGTYTLTSISDAGGVPVPVADQSAVITTASPGMPGGITGTNLVCLNQTGVSYSVPEITNATGYIWNLPNGATVTAGENTNTIMVSFTNVVAGNYTINVLGTNACGNGLPSAGFTVYVGTQNPIAAEPQDLNVCSGSNAVFNIAGLGENISYKWTYYTPANGWKPIANASSAVLTFPSGISEDGNLYSCYVSSTICGSTVGHQSRSARLSVGTAEVGVVGSISGSSSVYPGQTRVHYSIDPIENATDYIWQLPQGSSIISGINTPDILVNFSMGAVSGPINVMGRNACSEGSLSSAFDVTVNPLPEFTATISGSAVADSGQVVPLTIVCAGATGPYVVTYEFYDGIKTVTKTITIPDNNPIILEGGETGTYTLKTITYDGVTVPISGQVATVHICFKESLSLTPGNIAICESEEITIEGSKAPQGVFTGTGIIDVGDGTAKFKMVTPGEYEVTYTYINSYGCQSVQKSTVAVYQKPEVSFTGLKDSYLHESAADILSVTPAGGVFSGYSGISEQTDGTFKFSPNKVGQYNVVYTYNDGVCSNSQSHEVTIYSKPLAVVKGTGVMCNGAPTEIAIHFAGQPPYNFKYTDGTTETGMLTTSNSVYTITATEVDKVYSLTYYKDNRMEGTTSGSVQTIFQQSPTAQMSGNIEICANESGTLPVTFSSSGGIVFKYAINGLPQPEVATDKQTYNLSTRYSGTYTLVSVAQRGCAGTVSGSGQVVINPLPVIGITNLAEHYCQGASLITISGTPAGGTLTSDLPGFTQGLGSTATFKPDYDGEYIVMYAFSDGRCNNKKTMNLSVIAPPTASMGTVKNYCGETEGSIDIIFTGKGRYNLGWTRDGGSFAGNFEEDQGVIKADAAGLYSLVSVTSYGCAGTVAGEATIYKKEYPTIELPASSAKCSNVEIDIPVTLTGEGPWEYIMDGPVQTLSYTSESTTGSFKARDVGHYKITMVKDAYCENTEPVEFEVTNLSSPTAELTGKGGIINGEPAKLVVKLSGGYQEPYTFVYAIDGVGQAPIVTPGPQYTILATITGKYSLLSVSSGGCEVLDDGHGGYGGSGGGPYGGRVFGIVDVVEHVNPTAIITGGCNLNVGQAMDLDCEFTGSPVWTLTYTIDGGAEQEATFTQAESKLRIYTPGLYRFTKISDKYGESELTREILIKAQSEDLTCEECIQSFAPVPGEKYVLGAWVRMSKLTDGGDYSDAGISIFFEGANVTVGPLKPKGAIIDGWQRIEEAFIIPNAASAIEVKLVNSSVTENAYYDDIRIFPFKGNMKSYVYDPVTLRLKAVLDENNYATYYEYDEEGRLIRVKKETERGIKTIQESFNNVKLSEQ